MNMKKLLLLLPILTSSLVQSSGAKESISTEEKKTSERVTSKKTVKLFDGRTLDGWKAVVPPIITSGFAF